MQEHCKIENKIGEIESENPDISGDISGGLAQGEYWELQNEKIKLENEIEGILIRTKYFPLVGLTMKQKRELDCFSISSTLEYDKNIEKHLDMRLSELQV